MPNNSDMLTPDALTSPGRFVVGCNYWASHAGTAMWSDWRPDVVDADLRQLAEAGLQTLRVFPLWPDFQPIHILRTYHANPVEYRLGEAPLADGEAGVSEAAMARFAEFADLAERHGLKLIVGLITGWMSGRLFVPPGLEGRNPITDPVAVMWELRFVHEFVWRFKDHPAVLAWDLGNECNCLSPATREEAWVWTAGLVNAIRAEDRSRPVISGMHGLTPTREAAWTIQDQGSLTDVLTTHPYPYFTPHCDRDPVNTVRTLLHSAAESRWYADISGKPCLVEEIGTLGPMLASEAVAADFLRSVLFSAWAHDCHGLLWWCAYDLGHLEHAPYDWDAYERELGLIRADRIPKPVLKELTAFGRFIEHLPVPALPPRLTEAVCLTSEGQDSWGVAYSSFVLAKQAGFDLAFRYVEQPLPDAPLYLLPCIGGGRVLPRRRWLELLERVEAGATLYISHRDGMLAPLTEPLGFQVHTREHRAQPTTVTLDLPGAPVLPTAGPIKLTLHPDRAEVLGREADGSPALTRAPYGKGTIYFLTIPLEQELAERPGAFHAPDAPQAWQLYRHLAAPFTQARAIRKDHPHLGITEHPLNEQTRVIVLINYSPTPLEPELTLSSGWRMGETWYGSAEWVAANDGAVFTVVKA
ncbi:MAG: glycoside hydrolase 5 family protein [Armatimonadota bacterium]